MLSVNELCCNKINYLSIIIISKMVDCDHCVICFKISRNKKEYNLKKDWIARKKHYKCYKKEMDDNSKNVMLANWLLDRD